MSAQFGHIQTFSAKGNRSGRNYQSICLEAARAPGNMNHIPNPKPPLIIFGMDPANIPAEITRREEIARKASRGHNLRVRKDGHRLEGAVHSFPEPVTALSDPAVATRYRAWLGDILAYAKADSARRGIQLVSVVQHLDESHPHVHCLSIMDPATNPLMDAKAAHPGWVAQRACPKDGNPRKAYIEAMKLWQDDLFDCVSSKHGMVRISSSRARLARADWLAERKEKEELAAYQRQLKADAQRWEAEIQEAKRISRMNRARQAGMEAYARGQITGAHTTADGTKLFLWAPSVSDQDKAAIMAAIQAAIEWVHAWVVAMTQRLARAAGILAEAKRAGIELRNREADRTAAETIAAQKVRGLTVSPRQVVR